MSDPTAAGVHDDQATYRADIDGLRAVAVVLVVIFHAFPNWLPGGFIGVDVFFVISGYLITGIIRNDVEAGRFSFRTFYARRARRLLPALCVVIAVVLVVGWFILRPAAYAALGLQGLAGLFFVPNILFWQQVSYFDVAAETKPLLHLWSLGVEEQFYLVWPIVIALLPLRSRTLCMVLGLIALVSLACSLYLTVVKSPAAFYLPHSRLWELATGGLLTFRAVRRPSQLLSHIGLFSIIASAFLISKTSSFPAPLAFVPVAGTALVIQNRSSLLALRWPVMIGRFSYPLYLWHWPLLAFATIQGGRVRTRLLLVALSFVLAAATTHLIERPIRFGALRKIGVPLSLAAAVLLAVASGALWTSGGWATRYPAGIRDVLALESYDAGNGARVPACWLNAKSSFEDYAPECSRGAVVVWGDSHAGRLYTGLASAQDPVAQFTRNSCMPALGASYSNCQRDNVKILAHIKSLKPRRVILFAAWTNYTEPDGRLGPTLLHGLSSVIAQLKPVVQDIIVIGPPPQWEPDLPAQVYDFWTGNGQLPDRLRPAARDYKGVDAALASVSAREGARFESIFDRLCNDSGCLTHTDVSRASLISWDYGHFTEAGARFAAIGLGLK